MIALTEIAHRLKNLPMVERGGWTLLHSIWELAALAGTLALILGALKDAFARIRYLASTITMVLMFALPVCTFQIIGTPPLPPPEPTPAIGMAFASERGPTNSVGEGSPETRTDSLFYGSAFLARTPSVLKGTSNISWPARFATWIAPAIPWLMLTWSFGILVLSFWNFGGWIATQRLRSLGTSPVEPELANRLSSLANRVGLTRPIRMAKSGLVQIPVVIGFLNPLILMPISVLAGLPRAHLEAILAHELAHIRRHDYVVNLFQTFIETILFYHPAVWWVSRRIREEREHCCDDVAARICGDPRLYAEALVSVEELRPPTNSLVLAATGSGGQMFNRIRRLIGLSGDPSYHRSASLSAVFLSLCVLFLPIGCSSLALRQKPPTAELVTAAKSNVSSAKTAPSPVSADTKAQLPLATEGTLPLMLQIADLQPLLGSSNSGDYFSSAIGIKIFDGLPFEIKGSLAFFGQAGATGVRSVRGIQINRKFDELHLIHYVKLAADREGTPVVRFRLRYTDGTKYDLPILFGAQVRTYFHTPLEESDQPSDSDSKVVWRSPEVNGAEGSSYRLFETILRNPFPNLMVESINVFSEASRSCYCLVAATVARSDPKREVTPAVPLSTISNRKIDDLTVHVYDRTNQKPLPDALVLASLYTGGSNEIVIGTDSLGNAHLRYPKGERGLLYISVIKDGFGLKTVNWPRSRVPQDFRFELARAILIGGIVRDDAGKPVSEAIVRLHQHDISNGDSLRSATSIRTDTDGRWSMSGITPENYNFSIEVRHAGYATTTFLPDRADGFIDGERIDTADLIAGTAIMKVKAGK